MLFRSATDNGPIKPNLIAHNFIGGNYYFAEMRNPEHAKLSKDILRNALSLKVDKVGQDLQVKVTNTNTGHKMPGGARRQVWIELTVTDADGRQILSSGHLENGYLPADNRVFVKKSGDKHGKPVGMLFWRVEKILKDTRISPDETRVESFNLPDDTQFPIKVEAKINYRTFSKSLTEKVQKAFPEQTIPYAKVVTINTFNTTFNQ